MKRGISPLVMALVVAVGLSVIAVNAALSPGEPAFGGPPDSALDAMSNQQLIEALDETSEQNPEHRLLIGQRLWQRRKAIPRRDLVSAIADTSKPQETRELMVDLLAGTPEEAELRDDARDLLRDNRLNSALKARIIVSYDFDRQDAPLLGSLASSTEELVAFHALKKLGKANPAAARRIALATLSRPKDSSDSKLSASYKVLVRSGALQTDSATRGGLLSHLAAVLADKSTSPELLDSATFALSEMRSIDALRILLESTSIDRPLVVGAIDENAAVIKSALKQNPDESTIKLAVAAMEVYPVKDISEPLQAARSHVKSPALLQRLDAALVLIARDGRPINPKWTED